MKPMKFKILSILIASFVLWTIIAYVGNKSATNETRVETSEYTSESADSISFPFYDSKSALKFVRENLLPPSELDYKLDSPDKTDYTQYSDFPKIFKNYLKSKRNGFFIEAGAFDGETYSNTLALEKLYGWRGILVEPSTGNFAQLKSKNRKAHILNACLLNTASPKQVAFADQAAWSKLLAKKNDNDNAVVTCIPIGAILHFLNVRHIDYAVFDTEGSEPEILVSFPWETVTVDVFQIECNWCGSPQKPENDIKRHFIKTFLDIKGYDEVNLETTDFIYVRRVPNNGRGMPFIN